MKPVIRILVGLFALAGGVAWTVLLGGVAQIGMAMGGAGDGAVSGGNAIPPQAILWIALVWLVPVTAFAFMLLGALNVLRGALRHVGYWYALIFLVVAGSVMMVSFPQYYAAVKWVGFVCLLVSVLWCYAFRVKAAPAPQ